MTTTNSKPAALNSLRAIYRSAKAGCAIDPRGFVDAVVTAVVAGEDPRPAIRAFEPFAWVWLNHIGGADGVALVRKARDEGGMRAAICLTSILGWTEEWAAAMTAYYGPVGLHESYCDADGRPSAETLAKRPHIGAKMAEAAEKLETILGWRARVMADETRWAELVYLKKIAA